MHSLGARFTATSKVEERCVRREWRAAGERPACKLLALTTTKDMKRTKIAVGNFMVAFNERQGKENSKTTSRWSSQAHLSNKYHAEPITVVRHGCACKTDIVCRQVILLDQKWYSPHWSHWDRNEISTRKALERLFTVGLQPHYTQVIEDESRSHVGRVHSDHGDRGCSKDPEFIITSDSFGVLVYTC